MLALTQLALLASGILAGSSLAERVPARAADRHQNARRQQPSGSLAANSRISSVKFSYDPTASASSSLNSTPTLSSGAAACTGATLNVLGASLDWWYPQTYTYVASTLVVQYDVNKTPTGWIIEAAATPFDVSSALNAPICTATFSSAAALESTCNATPPPAAFATTVLTQTAYTPLPSTLTSGTLPLPSLAAEPPSAAITIPSAASATFAAGTPFVYFSRYEIATSHITTNSAGEPSCAVATTTYAMSAPFAFEYNPSNDNVAFNGTALVNAGVTGDVNPAFLNIVNATSASTVAGSWVAEPTVAVVVSRVIAVSQSVLDVPTPTLPAGISSWNSNTDTNAPSASPTPQVESSETYLLLPPSASSSSPSASSASAASTTVAPASFSTSSSHEIASASPTNALQVLTQAEATFSAPTSATNSAVQSMTNALQVLTAAEATFSNSVAPLGSVGLGSSGNVVVDGESSAAASPSDSNSNSGSNSKSGSSNANSAPILTLGGTAYTPIVFTTTGASNNVAVTQTGYVISSQTLTRDGAVTFAINSNSGPLETVSLNAAGNSVYAIVSGQTMSSAFSFTGTGRSVAVSSTATNSAQAQTTTASANASQSSGSAQTQTQTPTAGAMKNRVGGFLFATSERGVIVGGVIGVASFVLAIGL